MSDFLVDDWESLIDKDVEEIKAATNILTTPVTEPEPQIEIKEVQNKPKTKKEKAQQEFVVELPKQDKPKPLTNEEKRKAELLSRLANDNLIEDLFEGLSVEHKKVSSAQIILKNQKNFEEFAKTVSQRFDEDTTPSEFLQDFCFEILLNIYPSFDSSELRQLQQKLTILKNQKKKQDKKKKKEVKKQVKKEDQQVSKKSQVSEQKERDLRYVPGMEDFM